MKASDRPSRDRSKTGLGARLKKLLQALGTYVNRRDFADAGDLFQEGSLLRYRLEQGRREVAQNDAKREPRKARATTDVEQAAAEAGEAGDIEAFGEVPCDAFFRASDGGQVDLAIPSDQQLEVGSQLAELLRAQIQVEGFEEFQNRTLVKHREGF